MTVAIVVGAEEPTLATSYEGSRGVLFLLLAACAAGPSDVRAPHGCDPVVRFNDADHDGFGDPSTGHEACDLDAGVADGTDCDDTDPAVHPGAVEADCADPTDYDCDGSVAFTDADGDGTPACQDCDDADPGRNPAVVERCDGVDQDCDGGVDEEPVDGRDYYADADGDGFGDVESVLRSCALPEGYTTDPRDCDDTDASVNPDGVEVCDGVDDDCDGGVDDEGAVGATEWFHDADGDGWGAVARWACAAPPRHVTVSGDCADGDEAVNPGAVEVCDGIDNDCDGTADGADAVDALPFWEDIDGDGYGGTPTAACSEGAGRVTNGDDCDDGHATAHPGGTERCDRVDDDCDGAVDDHAVDAATWYPDADGDGYGDGGLSFLACGAAAGSVADDSDCDDGDPAVHPGADEHCDGTDEDCDGTDDDNAVDAPMWYRDLDGDGHGGAALRTACSLSGYLASSTDCDDTDASISPDAAEWCDGLDDDCDGVVDEADATDAATWYADADGDGYGDPATATSACEAAVGQVADGTDCDDGDATTWPGAEELDCLDPVDHNCDGSVGETDADGDGWAACLDCDDADAATSPDGFEVCDGVDQDCDGSVDEAGALGEPTWYADSDGDGHGDPAVTTEACDLPGTFVADADDCDDTDAAVSPSALETCSTAFDDDCDGDTNDTDAEGCVSWWYDLDADGHGSTTNACLCLAEGSFTANVDDDCDDTDAAVSPDATEDWGNGVDDDCEGTTDQIAVADVAAAVILGEEEYGRAGTAVARAGDVNGDGYGDVLVGGPGTDPAGSASGTVWLFLGPLEDGDVGAADATFTGENTADQAGTALSTVGDVDGDGLDDVVIGAERNGVYLLFGPATTSGGLSAADARWVSSGAGSWFGSTAHGGGDMDGDGVGDLVGGDPYADEGGGSESGATYVLDGASTGGDPRVDATALVVGNVSEMMQGWAVRAADVDGDGVADLVTAALSDPALATCGGSVGVFLGPLSGVIASSDADARFVGVETYAFAGRWLDVGDLDGDGGIDLLLGESSEGVIGRIVTTPTVSATVTGAAATILAGDMWEGTEMGAVASEADGAAVGEILLGADGLSLGEPTGGAAALLEGPFIGMVDPGDAIAVFTGVRDDRVGASVASAGDTDGDGITDFLIGATTLDGSYDDVGAAYLVLGR